MVEKQGEEEGGEEAPEADFFLRNVPEVALDDEATHDLPEEEEPHHKSAHELENVVLPSGKQHEADAGEQGIAALLPEAGGRVGFRWAFHFLRRRVASADRATRASVVVPGSGMAR